MKRPLLGLASATLLALLPATTRADVVVSVPYVRVQVGPVVSVRTPIGTIIVPRGVPARTVTRPVVPVPDDADDPGAPPPVPTRPVPSATIPSVGDGRALAVRPQTPAEFASTFRAASGKASYEVILTHPCTGAPVKVCFDLPGCPRRMRVTKTTLEFRYGLCKAVVVRFNRDGSVQVRGG